MAICRWEGFTGYFITFTCNLKWSEIRYALERYPSQRTEDRPDIVSRIFQITLVELIKDIKDEAHFEKVKACKYFSTFYAH